MHKSIRTQAQVNARPVSTISDESGTQYNITTSRSGTSFPKYGRLTEKKQAAATSLRHYATLHACTVHMAPKMVGKKKRKKRNVAKKKNVFAEKKAQNKIIA